jgi:hypothetical protein
MHQFIQNLKNSISHRQLQNVCFSAPMKLLMLLKICCCVVLFLFSLKFYKFASYIVRCEQAYCTMIRGLRACAIALLENAIAPQQSKPSVDISDARLNAAPLWTIHRHGPQRTRASTNSHNNQPHTPARPKNRI